LQVIYRYWTYVCNSESGRITLAVLFGYKVMLQIVALILATSIRKIKVKGLNDAPYIISAIYVTSIGSAVLMVTTYTLTEYVTVIAVVFSFCLIVMTTTIICLVFLPPVSSIGIASLQFNFYSF